MTATETHLADLEDSPFRESDPLSDYEPPRHALPTVERVTLPADIAFDPKTLEAALARETDNPLLHGLMLQGIEDPAKGVHPFDGLCKVCLQRRDDALQEWATEHPEGTPMPENLIPLVAKLDTLWRRIHPTLAPGWFPVNCCERCYAWAKEDHAADQRNRELWERLCPPDFRVAFDPKKGNAALLDRVLKFQMSEGRGLMIHGQSDAGKTRVVWQLLRKLAGQGISWLFIESIDLLDAAIPPEAFTAQLLVIDDLGNDDLKGAKEVRLLKLIRTRCNWHRPFIITTQFNGELLAEKFSDSGTAKAVIRRMRQFCDSVHARAPGEGGIQRDASGRPVMS